MSKLSWVPHTELAQGHVTSRGRRGTQDPALLTPASTPLTSVPALQPPSVQGPTSLWSYPSEQDQCHGHDSTPKLNTRSLLVTTAYSYTQTPPLPLPHPQGDIFLPGKCLDPHWGLLLLPRVCRIPVDTQGSWALMKWSGSLCSSCCTRLFSWAPGVLRAHCWVGPFSAWHFTVQPEAPQFLLHFQPIIHSCYTVSKSVLSLFFNYTPAQLRCLYLLKTILKMTLLECGNPFIRKVKWPAGEEKYCAGIASVKRR